jgi:hypothetical protein
MIEIYEAEAQTLLARCEGSALSEDQKETAFARVYALWAMINATPPSSVGDCVTKLRRLVDPDHGMEEGKLEGDGVALRQVLAFLEEHGGETEAVVGFGPPG